MTIKIFDFNKNIKLIICTILNKYNNYLSKNLTEPEVFNALLTTLNTLDLRNTGVKIIHVSTLMKIKELNGKLTYSETISEKPLIYIKNTPIEHSLKFIKSFEKNLILGGNFKNPETVITYE